MLAQITVAGLSVQSLGTIALVAIGIITLAWPLITKVISKAPSLSDLNPLAKRDAFGSDDKPPSEIRDFLLLLIDKCPGAGDAFYVRAIQERWTVAEALRQFNSDLQTRIAELPAPEETTNA